MKKLIIINLFVIIAGLNTHSQTVPSYVPTNGLIGWYPFNSNANDESGSGNNGTVAGATLTTDRFGTANTAYSFNGSSMIQALIPPAYAPSASNFYSISLWFNKANNTISTILLQYKAGQSTNVSNYDIFSSHGSCNIGTIGVQNYPFNNPSACSPDTIGIGDWINIYISFDQIADTFGVYKNGQYWFNGSIGNISPYSGLLTFGNNENGNFGFNGKIDDIGIWNRALTQQEISILYQSCIGQPNATITSYGNTSFCQGSDVLLTCNNNFVSYQWKKNGVIISGATNKSYTAKASGTYKCIVTCGVSTSTSNGIALTRLDNASNSITSTGSAAFCAGDSLMLSSTNSAAGYTFQWYRSNISINGATGINFTAKNPGTYKVVSKHPSNGCSRISSNGVSATVNCRLSNPGLISGPIDKPVKNLNVFPNPNNGSFTLEYTKEDIEDGTANVEIVNTLGKTIYSSQAEFANGQLSQEINLQDGFSKGIYMVNIILNGEKIGSKVLLQ